MRFENCFRSFTFVAVLLSFSMTLSAQTLSILGDSYSTFKGYLTPDTNAVWYPNRDNDVKRVEDTWWHILVKETGVTLLRNNSYSGSTICYRGYNGDDYRLRSFENRCDDLFSLDDHCAPDIILVFGCTNDSWSGAKEGSLPDLRSAIDNKDVWGDLYTYRPALTKMLYRMKKLYAKSKIVFILNSELRDDISFATRQICSFYGIPVVVLHNIDKQKGHPSMKGMRAIADQVKPYVTVK